MRLAIIKNRSTIISTLLLAVTNGLFAATAGDMDDETREEARTSVEFFEQLYSKKIEGVNPLDTYQDPDQFYSEIAKKVGIPKLAFEAVEKEFGWKQDNRHFLSAVVKGGHSGDYWGVMIARIPTRIKDAKSIEERKKLMLLMEMKFVLIGYDGSITFPKENTGGSKKTATLPPASLNDDLRQPGPKKQ